MLHGIDYFVVIVYMAGIFAVEFVSGWIFEVCGLVIWDYSHLKWNLFGYITALYVPVWYAAGLVVEAEENLLPAIETTCFPSSVQYPLTAQPMVSRTSSVACSITSLGRLSFL